MKKEYEAPELTIVTLRVEKGFSSSLVGAPSNVDFEMFQLGESEDMSKATTFGETYWNW
ncbi:MAG: hypothetical protein J6X58_01590 [Bacteroidales bacterium]|nr:hypothetical protein [Bacteroidales bacterium]